MLDTIIIGLLILSALVYGFWQYLAKPDDARDKRKSKNCGWFVGKHMAPCGTFWRKCDSSGRWSSQRRFFSSSLFYGSFSPECALKTARQTFCIPFNFDGSSCVTQDRWFHFFPATIHLHLLPFYRSCRCSNFLLQSDLERRQNSRRGEASESMNGACRRKMKMMAFRAVRNVNCETGDGRTMRANKSALNEKCKTKFCYFHGRFPLCFRFMFARSVCIALLILQEFQKSFAK